MKKKHHSALNQTFAQWLKNSRNFKQTQNTRVNSSDNSSENSNSNQSPHSTPETSSLKQRNMLRECENRNSNRGGFTPEQMRQLQALITSMSSNTSGPPGEREIPEAESPSERDDSLSLNSFWASDLSYFHSDLKASYNTQDII